LPHLQRIYKEFVSKGLVVLGFNWADDRAIVLRLLGEQGVTFPNVVDTSDEAVKVRFGDYKASAVPIQYFIDREGKIIDAWTGFDENRARRVLATVGIA
jgi:peroxiredoxin